MSAGNWVLLIASSFSGGYAGGVTPDPIPNSEVKPSRADGTARETVWESRTSPGLFTKKTPKLALRGFRYSGSGCTERVRRARRRSDHGPAHSCRSPGAGRIGHPVPGTGVEPVRLFRLGILSPLRLPISPPGASCHDAPLYSRVRALMHCFFAVHGREGHQLGSVSAACCAARAS